MRHPRVTHRCDQQLTPDGSFNNFCGDETHPCGARRWSSGSVDGARCGEPCSWIMGKSGHGNPPWRTLPDGTRPNPQAADGQPGAPL